MQVIYDITDWIWGNIIGYALLGVGMYLTIRLFFPQKHLVRAFRTMKDNLHGAKGGVSGFGTLMAALGGQLGTGALVGVSLPLIHI